ncbi:GIY-YIG nuclease family protein [[Clostridium] dakarense]|uniref:GIY-YIG nuclease family protein n=1 Tax=Faecalimicrobium dakarense TaxID=1301100 RepID=UPI0004B12B4B|nr:GIY-YIG nuclease family protein [[Clostridium] dakarense]
MSNGRLIRLFLVDGEGNGLRTVEISNMTIHTTIFPRQKLKDFIKRSEAEKPGVYILIGTENDSTKVYIGEGDPVLPRLKSHSNNKEFWNEAIVFTSKDNYITKTQIQYIESELIDIARKSHNIELDNSNNPVKPNISEVDEAEVSQFIESIKLILSSLGIDIFNNIDKLYGNEAKIDENTYILSSKNVIASMKIVDYKYAVLKGSYAVKECAKSIGKRTVGIRESLIEDKILVEDSNGYYIFKDDYIFNSPSAASDVILGASTNGRIIWKCNGKTLKDIEKESLS